MGQFTSKQTPQETKNAPIKVPKYENTSQIKKLDSQIIKDDCNNDYRSAQEKTQNQNNIVKLNSENNSNQQKNLKKQDQNINHVKLNSQCSFEQDGISLTNEQEQYFTIPNMHFTNKDIKNVQIRQSCSLIGHASNSNLFKALQYEEFIILNDFNKSETEKFKNQNTNFEQIDFQRLKYSKQFKQFRLYQYFKQKEQQQQKEIKSQEEQESENVESLMLNKVQESNYDLKTCGQEIALLALKEMYQNKGINLIFQRQKESDNNEQMNKTMMSCDQHSMQEQVDDYDDIQRHLTQTGFDLETYYQIKLEEDTQGEWDYNTACENKERFARYFKLEIRKKYINLQVDDIIILNIQKGSTIVDFMSTQQIENIQIGNQRFDKIPVKCIVQELKIQENYFNPKYNMSWGKSYQQFYRGNINGQVQQYHLPVGYYGLGLNVLDNKIYPNDGWLNTDTSDATWIVLFHATDPKCANKILQEGLKAGTRQAYKDRKCRFGRGYVGIGAYFSNEIKNCEEYCKPIDVGKKKFQLIFQCRVNPKTIKSPEGKEEYYVCNNPQDTRPYRILIKEYQKSQKS